ncbi:MAG: hypothetical protein BEN18_02060 [Epulopiscium sp. Nuni2H_MBin001]|nr:MAG: hypothetical protein BEN18_02060 [Epulopiscium sp. Nuni2H_MBin001]
MGLCRYLPTPSDRMGLLWSLLSVKQSIILEYGPAGTTHYSMGFLGKLGIEQREQIFTTHMTEDDVIMGDVSRLENSIIELDESFSPKVIFVVASSTSEVIGTDIKGVCKYMQQQINAKLIACDVGGFRGDYSVGVSFAYKKISELVLPSDERLNTFNLIGLSVGNFRAVSDKNEIVSLVEDAFNMTLGTALCCETSICEIEHMSSATINLVVSADGLQAAKYLKQKFNTPYVYGVPYGYAQTKSWLMEIGNVLGKEPLMPLLDKKIMESGHYQMYKRMLKVSPKVAVVGDYDRVVGLCSMMQSLGAHVVMKICLHTISMIDNVDDEIVYFNNESDRIKALESLDYTFILADEVSGMVVNKTNTTMCVNAPTVYKSQVATHMPIVGVRGADMIREVYDEYLRGL